MPTIRDATAADATAWARVVAAASPYLVQDAASTAHEMATEPPDARRLVAEQDGLVVGIARLRVSAGEGHVSLQLMTHPDHRRQGVGGALLAACQPAIGRSARGEVHSVVEDDDPSRAAARRWGFELTRTFRMSALDPRSLPAPPPDDRVTRLDSVDPRAVWELHIAVVRDDPSGLSLSVPWEEWHDDWTDPRNRPGLSHGVRVDGRLVAFSQLGCAGDRAWSNMTGVLPEHRGGGLAVLCKQHTLHAAGRAGIARCFAGNDGRNAPMVAVNDRLGYRPFAAPRLGVRRS